MRACQVVKTVHSSFWSPVTVLGIEILLGVGHVLRVPAEGIRFCNPKDIVMDNTPSLAVAMCSHSLPDNLVGLCVLPEQVIAHHLHIRANAGADVDVKRSSRGKKLASEG
jgi:hypothetical protein